MTMKESFLTLIKKFATLLKFMSSGVICFLIDQGLFNLFDHVIMAGLSDWWRVLFATVISRVISSFINFTLNRKVVFASDEDYKVTLVKYYILCALQLLASAGITYLLKQITGVNETFTKLVADGILFIISYNIQRVLIFKKNNIKEESK